MKLSRPAAGPRRWCRRAPDDVDVALALEHGRDAFAHDGMVVDDEHANHARCGAWPRRAAWRGTVTVMVVPRPGALRIAARPPTRRARSSMPTRPNPRARAAHAKTGAGIRDGQAQTAARPLEPQRRLARAGVLADVGQRLAGDAEQLRFDVGAAAGRHRRCPVRTRTPVSAVNWRDSAPSASASGRFSSGDARRLRWTASLRRGPGAPRRAPARSAGARRSRGSRLREPGFDVQRDGGEPLRERVVDVAGDARRARRPAHARSTARRDAPARSPRRPGRRSSSADPAPGASAAAIRASPGSSRRAAESPAYSGTLA